MFDSLLLVVGVPDSVQSHVNSIVPTDFSLGDNFPNPFNPTTTIPIYIPEEMNISVEVYNILGQKVQTLHNGPVTLGKHLFIWQGCDSAGRSVPTGIYFVKTSTSTGITSVGKMLLIK